jgi:hypothetical protein
VQQLQKERAAYRRYYGTTLREDQEIRWECDRFEAAAAGTEEKTELCSGARTVLEMYRRICYKYEEQEEQEQEQDQNI